MYLRKKVLEMCGVHVSLIFYLTKGGKTMKGAGEMRWIKLIYFFYKMWIVLALRITKQTFPTTDMHVDNKEVNK